MNRFSKLTLLIGCFLTGGLLYGQFETAEVLGTVRDPTGGGIPGASVTLTNLDTGIQATTTTDENGSYDFFNVKAGRYSVAVEHAGFSKLTTPDVGVTVNARQRVDVTMQIGAITESVEVTGVAAALETDTSEHGQVINTTAVTELPLNGRNYADLALLSTNTVKSPMSATFSATGTPREAAFNVNGMRSTYNNFLLDGMDNNSYGTSNQGYSSQLVQLSPDALAEFRVITSNYSAEYGRVGGAVISAVMKSGTNQLHGSAYEFLRNTDLNATGFLFSPAVFVKPTLQRNQFGATIGGPIIKNKLFFFGDYEGLRQLQRYLNFDSIPSMTDRQGILPVTVVNPLTGVVYPANTQIPVAQLNPFAATALAGLPPTNGPGRSNNDEALLLIRDYGDKYDAKIDGQINDRMTAFLRFSQRKDLQYYAPDLTGPSGGDGNGYIHTIDQNASLGYTWTVTPTSMFEARLGFSHMLGRKDAAVCRRPEHVFHVPRRISRPADHTQSHRRTQHADHHRAHRHWAAKPAIRSSRIPLPGTRNSTIRKPSAGIPSKWAISICTSAPRFWTPIRFTARTPTAGTSASPPVRNWASPPLAPSRPTTPATAWRISCSALPTKSTWAAIRSSICGNSCTPCTRRTISA